MKEIIFHKVALKSWACSVLRTSFSAGAQHGRPLARRAAMAFVSLAAVLLVAGWNSTSSSAAENETAEEPALPADLDPLAPGGIVIGMRSFAASEALLSNGYRRSDINGHFYLDRGTTQRTIILDDRSGGFEGPIARIYYRELNLTMHPTSSGIIDALSRKLNAKATCRYMLDDAAGCQWRFLAQAPLVSTIEAEVDLESERLELVIEMSAIEDMEAQLRQGVALYSPAPVKSVDLKWWEKEIDAANAEAKINKFTGSKEFDDLPPGKRLSFSKDAIKVYEYCSKQGLFSALYDCRCVAGRFIDERAARERAYPDYSGRAIQIADEIAWQCPYKAGVAGYTFNRCMGYYRSKMKEDVEQFCTCYADTVATAFMKQNFQRNVSTQDITNLGSFAIQECRSQGVPSPLDR